VTTVRIKRSRLLASILAGVVVVVAVGAVMAVSRSRPVAAKDEVPLAEVKRGEIDLRVPGTAELRASHSIMLEAPAIGGDSLLITHLVRAGEMVKKGDVVMEFDPSEQHYKLEQSRSELLQAEQEIAKAKADAVVQASEDKVALLKARHEVRRAELQVQTNELVSKIDGEKNQLALEQARRALAQLEKDIESHLASGEASTYLAREKSNKAKLAMEQAQSNLEKMRVTAPMDGLVSIQKNENAAGGFYFTGMTLPDFHPGDQVEAGTDIAQIVDPLGMDLTSKISEQDHANVITGQAVEVVFDALPERTFHGTVKSVGGMSQRGFFQANTGGSFDVSIQLADADANLRSGLTAQVVYLAGSKKNVLYLPRQALFMKDGKRIVYVKKNGGYEQREVKIQSETESRAAVAGLDEGSKVALIDPTAPRKSGGGGAPASGMGGAL
jgi:HlyD family secretion protein